MGKITEPQKISAGHQLSEFDCGVQVLNKWLVKQALKNESRDASRTFVVCHEQEVIGYYSLATGVVLRSSTPSNISRNMPDPIPVMILGRLAVDKNWHSHGIGQGLLKDAMLRTLSVSEQVGVKAIIVHAISEQAKIFYLRCGFIESRTDKMMLMISLKNIQHIVTH